MGELSFEKLLVIGVVLLILFGSKKIPELMRGLGKGVREFNDAKTGMKEDFEAIKNEKKAAESNNLKSTSTITDLDHEQVTNS